jgi:hypothetical protein
VSIVTLNGTIVMLLLDFLASNSEVLTVVFTAVVTLSTVVYAILTASLVSETRKMREVQTEPKLHITIESFDFAVNIVRLSKPACCCYVKREVDDTRGG